MSTRTLCEFRRPTPVESFSRSLHHMVRRAIIKLALEHIKSGRLGRLVTSARIAEVAELECDQRATQCRGEVNMMEWRTQASRFRRAKMRLIRTLKLELAA
ncbi:MAG: hypothetical protein A2Y38_16985 [Spirochaetes bacterium GWB1_59_5]|nr:MAG: hypothetical protein A2Y38_16985 [Spirochaetes bacterium GWB1_59_5]